MPGTDDDVWAAYAKGVKPIKARVTPAPLPSPRSVKRKEPAVSHSVAPKTQTKPSPPVDFFIPLDRSRERRLRAGTIAIEARLDLHGMREAEAHAALMEFIAKQVKAEHRCLLVITGKGRGGTGVLRSKLGDWLGSSPAARHILALRPAADKHGGSGAFYVLLKKNKG